MYEVLSALYCFLQFLYDKAQETSILFHIKDKYTEKMIDSTLNGMFCLSGCIIGRIVLVNVVVQRRVSLSVLSFFFCSNTV